MSVRLLDVINTSGAAIEATRRWQAKGYKVEITASSVRVENPISRGANFFYELDDFERFSHSFPSAEVAAQRTKQDNKRPRYSTESAGQTSTEQPKATHRSNSGSSTKSAENIDDLRAEIARLEAENERLRTLGRAAVKGRDEWREKASKLEEQLAATADRGGDRRYSALRSFVAREFHPDGVKSGTMEHLIRTEVFKTLWAKIQEIDRSGR